MDNDERLVILQKHLEQLEKMRSFREGEIINLEEEISEQNNSIDLQRQSIDKIEVVMLDTQNQIEDLNDAM